MGLLSTLVDRRSSLENPSTSLSNPAAWLYEALGGEKTDAGISVTPKSALTSAAFACGHVLAQSVAQLPWNVYQRTGDNRNRADNRLEDYLLHSEPNGEMTSYSFRYAMVMRMCFYGKQHVEIVRDAASRTKELRPIFDGTVRQLRDDSRRLIGYAYRPVDGNERRIPIQNMIHVPCIPTDGVEGESILTQARNKIGLELQAEKFGSKLFAQGTRASGVLESDQKMTGEERKQLAQDWQALWAGADNAAKTPVLAGGLKWKQININPDDAQFLETRNFQVADIARMFRVPGILIGLTDKAATYASVEQFLLSFAKFTLAPWLQCIEQEFNRKLFPGNTSLYSKIDLRGLERGDLAARSTFYNTMTNIGAYTPNRVLALEDENGFEGGDMHLQPLNMGEFGKAPEPQPAAAPPTPPAPEPKAKNARDIFMPLFQSAVSTITKKSKRDAAWVTSRFEPLLDSLAVYVGRVAEPSQRAVYLSGLCVRAAGWSEESTAAEFELMLAFLEGSLCKSNSAS